MQTIYSIDYLNGLTMNELYKIAREYPHFSYSKIEKDLNANSNVVRETLKNNRTNSKLATEIRKSLIAYIHKAQIYNGDTAYDLYQKVLTRTRLNYTDIGRIIGCSPETVSRMINGNEANKRILDLKQYLTEVIEKHKPVKFTIEEIMEHNKKDWSHEAATMLYEKESTDNMLNKHNELLKAQQNKNPEFYNYLNSLTTIELCDLAKQYLNFSFAEMEQTLGISNGGVRQAARAKTSKFTSSIRAYLIDFLLEADASNYMPKEELNLKELFQEVEKYRHVTQSEIADAIGCAETTIYMCKLGKNKSKTAYQIKRYLESIINQYKSKIKDVKEEEQMSNELNLEELFDKVNNFQKLTKKQIAEDLNCAQSAVVNSITGLSKGRIAHLVKEYLENIIIEQEQLHGAEFLKEFNLDELFKEANKYQKVTKKQIAEDLNCKADTVSSSIRGQSRGETAYRIKEYLENIIIEQEQLHGAEFLKEFNLDELFKEANKYQKVTKKQIAEDLNCKADTVSSSIRGQSRGETAYRIKEYLENIINQYKPLSETNQKMQEQDLAQEEAKEQETMTEETFTEDKEMKTYDNFLNFIDIQKELPIVKKALEETLKENQNLDKILAKEEFITIETAQELNEKLFANEYTEEEILDFENQYFGTTDNASLKDKIKSFVEKHNLSLETALKLLQISEEDYKKMLEGADKVSNKTADKIYKAISAFDEFYHSEKTQDTINNTKNTFVTGFAIASAKSQTFLNKGLNKFADFLNKSADKIKNSNSENKED